MTSYPSVLNFYSATVCRFWPASQLPDTVDWLVAHIRLQKKNDHILIYWCEDCRKFNTIVFHKLYYNL